MDEKKLLATIEGEESSAYGYHTGELADERAENLSFYLGDPFGNEQENRSKVVLTDVSDTVEWVLPSLMRVFMAGDDIVSFDPVGPEDEEGAKQETDYINHVVNQKNNSFTLFYTWFKDALISKNGYVKFWYEENIDLTEETYDKLTDQEFQILLSQDVEPIEHSEETIETMTPQGPMLETLHSVKVKRTKKTNRCKICSVPPEEILVSINTSSVHMQDCDFVQHRPFKTISEIREMGYDIPDDIASYDENRLTEELETRDQYEELIEREDHLDPAMRRVCFKETYIRTDYDGDGFAELRKVVIVGKKILENETVDSIPFACLSPILMPHRHVGRALADLVKDLQLIRSTIMRQVIDNMVLQNNVGIAVDKNTVNLEDCLVDRPGKIVRVDGTPAMSIQPLQTGAMGSMGFQMLEYLEQIKEARTGVTKYNQGLDANSLNKTAAGISQIMGAAQQRIELIARTFAETGVKDLFRGVHELILKHYNKEEKVKLNNTWVVVDPRQWTKRTDMTISVGLGTGNKDQMLAHLMNIFQSQMQTLQIGVTTPKNIFNTLSKMAENSGFKMPEEFFTDPSSQQAQMMQQQQAAQQQQAMQAQLQAQVQAMQQKFQAEMQMKQQEMQAELQMKREEMMSEIQMEREKLASDIQLDRQKVNAEIQIKQAKAQSEVQLSVAKANRAQV